MLATLRARFLARRSIVGWLALGVVAVWKTVDAWGNIDFILGKLPLIQGWLLAVGAYVQERRFLPSESTLQWLLLFGGLAWIYVTASARPVRRRLDSQPYNSHGLMWELTPTFWRNYSHFDADNAYSLLKEMIRGPLCPSCKRDASEDLKRHRQNCIACTFALSPSVPIEAENDPRIISSQNSDPLWPLWKSVYREAQAAARRGELKPRVT